MINVYLLLDFNYFSCGNFKKKESFQTWNWREIGGKMKKGLFCMKKRCIFATFSISV